MKKEYVREELGVTLKDIIYNTPTNSMSVEDFLQCLKEEAQEKELDGLKNIFVEVCGDYGDYYLCLTGERLETDAEFNARKKKLEKQLQREQEELEKQRQEYLKLKAKFEPEENKTQKQ